MAALIQLLLNKKQFMCFLSVRVCYYNKLVGLNLVRVIVNIGKHNGLNVLVQDEGPWFEVVHYFNDLIELAIKDAFNESKFY